MDIYEFFWILELCYFYYGHHECLKLTEVLQNIGSLYHYHEAVPLATARKFQKYCDSFIEDLEAQHERGIITIHTKKSWDNIHDNSPRYYDKCTVTEDLYRVVIYRTKRTHTEKPKIKIFFSVFYAIENVAGYFRIHDYVLRRAPFKGHVYNDDESMDNLLENVTQLIENERTYKAVLEYLVANLSSTPVIRNIYSQVVMNFENFLKAKRENTEESLESAYLTGIREIERGRTTVARQREKGKM